jgi:hypothetical protein
MTARPEIVLAGGKLLHRHLTEHTPKLEPDFFRPPPIDYVARYPRPDEPLLSIKVL